MRELRAKGTKGYTSRGAVDRPNTATFKKTFYTEVAEGFAAYWRGDWDSVASHLLRTVVFLSGPSNLCVL
jgi:hypothetical protein